MRWVTLSLLAGLLAAAPAPPAAPAPRYPPRLTLSRPDPGPDAPLVLEIR